MASPFLGIDHLGVVVRDLDAAKATYRDVLGFALQGGEALPARGLEVAFVDCGSGPSGRLELIAPTRDDSEVSKFLDRRGEGLHHVCVRVRDLDAAMAEMKARGAKLIDEVPRSGAHGTRVAFLHPKGTHGVLLELIEYP